MQEFRKRLLLGGHEAERSAEGFQKLLGRLTRGGKAQRLPEETPQHAGDNDAEIMVAPLGERGAEPFQLPKRGLAGRQALRLPATGKPPERPSRDGDRQDDSDDDPERPREEGKGPDDVMDGSGCRGGPRTSRSGKEVDARLLDGGGGVGHAASLLPRLSKKLRSTGR